MTELFRKMILLQVIFLSVSNLFSQNLVATTVPTQILYQNLDNPIYTNINCYDDSITLTTENGEIEYRGDQLYWTPNSLGKSYLKLKKEVGNSFKTLDSVLFNVIFCPIPNIDLNLKEQHSGISSWRSQKLVFNIDEEYSHLKLNEMVEILSFELFVTRVTDKGSIAKHRFRSKNEWLPMEFDSVKNQLKPGDNLILEFRNIELDCSWSKTFKYYDVQENDYLPNRIVKFNWDIR